MSTSSAPRKVLLTGGGTGIGRAIALRLARDGCSIAIVNANSLSDAERTAQEVNEVGGRAIVIRADVTDRKQVEHAVHVAATSFEGLDWLVNNAGATHQLAFADLDAVGWEMWDDLFAVNVKGVFEACRVAGPILAASADGAILNVGSVAGITGFGSSIPYAVSKAANHGLTRSLAKAMAPIRVNGIAPGAVETRWWEGNEAKMAQIVGAVPLQRNSTPDDIADTACSLLRASSLTGQIVILDNGFSL